MVFIIMAQTFPIFHMRSALNNVMRQSFVAIQLMGVSPGINFAGNCSGSTVLSDNHINHHIYGLMFRKEFGTGATEISEQYHTGNTWLTSASNYPSGGKGAYYADLNNNPPFNFYYSSNYPNNFPPSATPATPEWFIDEKKMDPILCGIGILPSPTRSRIFKR